MENTATNRVTKNKMKIADAIVTLMEKSRFQDITVMEICYEAEVARKTYYNNFASKENVLEFKLSLYMDDFLQELFRRGKVTYKSMVHTYFSFAYSHYDFIKILVDNDLFYILLKAYDKYLPYMSSLVYQPQNTSSDFLEYGGSFFAGGLWHMLERWIMHGCKKSPDEMSNLFIKITKEMYGYKEE